MVDYMNKYGYTPDREAIGRALEIIAANLENVASESVYKECFSMMDLTTLKTDDTPASVEKLVEKVNAFHNTYPDWPPARHRERCIRAADLEIMRTFTGHSRGNMASAPGNSPRM